MRIILMYICICNAVTDKDIRDAIKSGQCACLRTLGVELGVGTNCGNCHSAAEEIIQEVGTPPRTRTEKL